VNPTSRRKREIHTRTRRTVSNHAYAREVKEHAGVINHHTSWNKKAICSTVCSGKWEQGIAISFVLHTVFL
jgi:hypothetical protein